MRGKERGRGGRKGIWREEGNDKTERNFFFQFLNFVYLAVAVGGATGVAEGPRL